MSQQQQTCEEYIASLQKEAKSRKKIVRFVDYINEDATPNPTANDQQLRYVMISPHTQENIDRLSEACSMIGRDKWNDYMGMTNTSSSYQFHRIFRVELDLCSDLIKRRRFNLCLDSLVALIFIWQSYDAGFYDTDDPQEVQNIFDTFSILWKDIMSNKDKETIMSTFGFVREFSDKETISVPTSLIYQIKAYNNYIVQLDTNTRIILYDILNEFNDDFSGFPYSIDCGRYTNNVIEDNYIWDNLNQAIEEKMDDEILAVKLDEIKKKKVSELKEMCRKRHFLLKGKKYDLICRLINPKEHILELKRKYHYEKYCKRSVMFGANESEEKIQNTFCWRNQFAENKYIWKDGKVTCNTKWNLEQRGLEHLINIFKF
eukprot:235643_1